MAKFYDHITEDLQAFISKQHIFFVATAPLSAEGHVNLSPKGYNSFRILSDHQVAYLDMTGSGNETSAHLAENGRITFMWCSFDTAPMILRLYGQGRVVLPGSAAWDELSPRFELLPGARQIITASIDLAQTSCGFAIPFYEYTGERDTLVKWAEARGSDGLVAYHQQKNACSLDELPTPLGEALQRE